MYENELIRIKQEHQAKENDNIRQAKEKISIIKNALRQKILERMRL